MNLIKRDKVSTDVFLSASRITGDGGKILSSIISDRPEVQLYDSLRNSVPVIDAAINKIVRLTGGYRLTSEDMNVQKILDDFVSDVKVGASGRTLYSFTDTYLESLLTYGSAVGEIIRNDKDGKIIGVCNCSLKTITAHSGKTPVDIVFFKNEKKVANSEDIVFTALNPKPEKIYGTSLLKGLPYISSILMRIYESIGQNFDRVGNVRYAVTYKPQDANDRAFAKERAELIAKEWSEGMQASKSGIVRDFIAVGDVEIKAIGADNQEIDTAVPVKELMEQIVAKLSIPPFLLGLSWNTTERMSSQQADILTSELEFYRRLLEPVIKKIVNSYLEAEGKQACYKVIWDNINLQDEAQLANAKLSNARAEEILKNMNEKGEK